MWGRWFVYLKGVDGVGGREGRGGERDSLIDSVHNLKTPFHVELETLG